MEVTYFVLELYIWKLNIYFWRNMNGSYIFKSGGIGLEVTYLILEIVQKR